MKTLTDKEIIYILDHLCDSGSDEKCKDCPLNLECLYYFTGEKCGSTLEINDSEKAE
jgi:hypothetical protein